MANQKDLKNLYRDILASDVWAGSPDMVDWSVKKVAHIVQLSNGDIIAIDKPSIKKDFCFGYSDSRYDTKDYDRANDMAAHARSSVDYFMQENLAGLDSTIAQLSGTDGRFVPHIRIPYSGQSKDSKLKAIQWYGRWDDNKDKYPALTGDDLQRVIDGYKIVRDGFVKRLNTYLKRYGLQHVNSWSYWRDA